MTRPAGAAAGHPSRSEGLVVAAVLGPLAGLLKFVAVRLGLSSWVLGLAVASMVFALAGITVALIGVARTGRSPWLRVLAAAASILPLVAAAWLLAYGQQVACD